MEVHINAVLHVVALTPNRMPCIVSGYLLSLHILKSKVGDTCCGQQQRPDQLET